MDPTVDIMIEYRIGDRVLIYDDRYPTFWANGVMGTIKAPPDVVNHLDGNRKAHIRMVQTTFGAQPFYWIALDVPRYDGDGDGPYHEAEFPGRALRRMGGGHSSSR